MSQSLQSSDGIHSKAAGAHEMVILGGMEGRRSIFKTAWLKKECSRFLAAAVR